jgi:hypothetical protein
MRSVGNYKHGRLEELASLPGKPQATKSTAIPEPEPAKRSSLIWPRSQEPIGIDHKLVKQTISKTFYSAKVYQDYLLLETVEAEEAAVVKAHRLEDLLQGDLDFGIFLFAKKAYIDYYEAFAQGYLIASHYEDYDTLTILDIESKLNGGRPRSREKYRIDSGRDVGPFHKGSKNFHMQVCGTHGELTLIEINSQLWLVDIDEFVKSKQQVLTSSSPGVMGITEPAGFRYASSGSLLAIFKQFHEEHHNVAVINVDKLIQNQSQTRRIIKTPDEPQLAPDSVQVHGGQLYIFKSTPSSNKVYRLPISELGDNQAQPSLFLANETGETYHFTLMEDYILVHTVDQLWFLDLDRIPAGASLDFKADYVHGSLKLTADMDSFQNICKVGDYLALNRYRRLSIMEAFR